MATIDIGKMIPINIIVTRPRGFKVRMTIALILMRLAAIVAPLGMEIIIGQDKDDDASW
jgi:hypothetical protein